MYTVGVQITYFNKRYEKLGRIVGVYVHSRCTNNIL